MVGSDEISLLNWSLFPLHDLQRRNRFGWGSGPLRSVSPGRAEVPVFARPSWLGMTDDKCWGIYHTWSPGWWLFATHLNNMLRSNWIVYSGKGEHKKCLKSYLPAMLNFGEVDVGEYTTQYISHRILFATHG